MLTVGSISELSPGTWDKLVSNGSKPTLTRVEDQPEFRPFMRLVVSVGDTPVAGITCKVVGTTLRILFPKTKAELDDSVARAAFTMLLKSAEERAASSQLGLLALQAKPDDSKNIGRTWISALVSAGFLEISSARIHSLDLVRADLSLQTSSKYQVSRTERMLVGDPLLLSAFRKVRSNTHDRQDSKTPITSGLITDLEAAAGSGPIWHVATSLCGDIVGYLLSSHHMDGGDRDASAWVLDIGVIPDWRRNGVGQALLKSAAVTARSAGWDTLKSLIDELNLSSLHLHAIVGFIANPTHYMVFEKTIRY